MNRSRRQNPLVVALYLNAALLAVIVILLFARSGPAGMLPLAHGQQQLPIGGGGGVFIVPAQFSDSSYGCYIMDIDAQTLCAYQYFQNQLRLIAARNFRWDRRLNQFNSDKPSPLEVQEMVEAEMQAARVREAPQQRIDPETGQPHD